VYKSDSHSPATGFHLHLSLQTSNNNITPTTSITMSAHTQLNSKAEFDKAIQEQDKYVFIYCYEGTPSSQAEE
jgi:hypothetical protein